MVISLIVAVSENFAIGKDNKLMWHLPADLIFFKEKTIGYPIIMGRKTFESIGRPLPKRRNIVITKNLNWHAEGVEIAHNIKDALNFLSESKCETAMVVGGAEIYKLALPLADRIFITLVHTIIEGDVYFPSIDEKYWKLSSSIFRNKDDLNQFDMTFMQYDRI